MELVNRETNFNKVFNAEPKVGLLNPLTIRKVGFLSVYNVILRTVSASVLLNCQYVG